MLEGKKKQKEIREYLSLMNKDMVKFVKSVLTGTNKEMSFALSPSNERHKNDIKNIVGIDTDGYKTEIWSSEINHINKRHGENGVADRTISNLQDWGRIEFVLDNYDSIIKLDDTTAAVSNSDNTPSVMIKVSKRLDGTQYVVEAVSDSGRKTSRIMSSYLEKRRR